MWVASHYSPHAEKHNTHLPTAFLLPVTAAQVGTHVVGQYYQMLHNQPDFVYQFYSDASTMLRIDGNTRDTATAMLQLHRVVISLNYTRIEIKTAHSLESWNGGVLVMLLGSVHVKDINGRKKFVETVFLAPQEKGYFILNNIFQYVDEQQILQHPIAYLPQSNRDAKHNTTATIREQVSKYILGGDIQSREIVTAASIEDQSSLDNYNYCEDQLQQVSEAELALNDNFAVQPNGSLQGNMNSIPGNLSSPIEDRPVMESQKHAYASILQVAKEQSAPASFNKPVPPDWQHVPEPSSQPMVASPNPIERSTMETIEKASGVDDEFEVNSVYVRNVQTTMAASEIAEEFKKFGKLKPDGVAIRTRKDIDVCYAFVEFEDMSRVQNTIKASTVQIGSHQLYIEGRRPNRFISFRGGRARGRGIFSYQESRRRFVGHGFGRGSNQDSVDGDCNRQEEWFLQASASTRKVVLCQPIRLENGQYLSESANVHS